MKRFPFMIMVLAVMGVSAALLNGPARGQSKHLQLSGSSCSTPPSVHCPASDCSPEIIANNGSVIEPKTGRTYFLDYPCDLKPGEKVTLVLSLHGGGSNGNWQRHYFPLLDFKDKYRLVIATPYSPTRVWSPNDDAYLENIVTSLVDQIGKKNIKAFWLAGHSQGGQTSNRLLYTPFYASRVDGWVSLSGGRLGSKRSEVRAPIPSAPPITRDAATTAPPAGTPPQEPRLAADASVLPDSAFSHIYTSGQHELPSTGLPANSKWADKLKCGGGIRKSQIVDDKAGYVYDSRPQTNPNAVWGRKPKPGAADVFTYSGCSDGRVVADIIRLDKGHTEGLEPHVTEAIVKMMVSANGGKIQKLN